MNKSKYEKRPEAIKVNSKGQVTKNGKALSIEEEAEEFNKAAIDNTYESAIKSGKWSNPGAALYDKILRFPGDWERILDEAYLEVGNRNIKNSPYGRTPFSRADCKYPHHVWVGGDTGKLVVSIPGLKAAYSRAKQMGVFSGKIKEHLERHYKEMNIYEDSTMDNDRKLKENFEFIENTINGILGTDLYEEDTNIITDEIYKPESVEFDEKSHGKKQFDFRKVFDFNTGHALKIVYDIDSIEVVNVGTGYIGGDASPDKRKEYIDYLNKNIKKVGNADHCSRNQKVLAIIDRVTGERLKEAEIIGPFVNSIHPAELKQPKSVMDYLHSQPDFVKRNVYKIKVGEVDTTPRFKSTHWFSNSDGKEDIYDIGIPVGVDTTVGRGTSLEALRDLRMGSAKLNDIDMKGTMVPGDYPKFNHPSKKDIREHPNLYNGEKLVNESIESLSNWIDRFVHDDIFRENGGIEEDDLFSESKKTPKALQYDFRLGYDLDTGHQTKIVYSLDKINISGVGDHYLKQHNNRDEMLQDYMDPLPDEANYNHIDWVKKNIRKEGDTDHESKGQTVLAIVDLVDNSRKNKANIVGPNLVDDKHHYIFNTYKMIQDKETMSIARSVVSHNNELVSELEVGKVDDSSSFKSTYWPRRAFSPEDFEKIKHGELDKTDAKNYRWTSIIRNEDFRSGRATKLGRVHPEGMFPLDAPNSDTHGGEGFKIIDNPNKHELISMLNKLKVHYQHRIRKLNRSTNKDLVDKFTGYLDQLDKDIEYLRRDDTTKRKVREIAIRWFNDPTNAKPKLEYVDMNDYSIAAGPRFFEDLMDYESEGHLYIKPNLNVDDVVSRLNLKLDYMTEQARSLLGSTDHISLEKYRRYRRQIDRIYDDLYHIESSSSPDLERIAHRWVEFEYGDDIEVKLLTEDTRYHNSTNIMYYPEMGNLNWEFNKAYKFDTDNIYDEEFYIAADGDFYGCIEEATSLPDNSYYHITDFMYDIMDEYDDIRRQLCESFLESSNI